ncbi:hypothetical protein XU18_4434 [Perkinsela sp. CCAP 1560/4]|nr:hypothetical protein XU18_4434 [Perkinsela sp. CCAP 1560/4]|eukprot:KNH04224.1 hypothetical protein XU18_4434 [Perkinsela sp. CCAP 1560/4]
MRRSVLRFGSVGAAWADSIFRTKKGDVESSMSEPQPDKLPTASVKQSPFVEVETTESLDEVEVYQPDDEVKPEPTPKPTFNTEMFLSKEKILAHEADIIRKTYDGVDVRSPSTLPANHLFPDAVPQRKLTWRDQVLAVSDFMSGHLAHHVMLDEWAKLLDLETLDVEIRYFIWILHLQMISRRSLAIPVENWARRREVLQEMQASMRSSWEESCTQVLGRPPPQRQKDYLRDMYLVVAMNFEEALSGTEINASLSDSKEIVPSKGDGKDAASGSDLALMSFLFRFLPFQRPEDIPMYSYYRLVHYIRFHLALLDRISDEDVSKGNFNFVNPLSEAICENYQDIPLR